MDLIIPDGAPEERHDRLTPEQEKIVLDEWNSSAKTKPSLKDLTKLVFGPKADSRAKEGIMIKRYLASLGFKPRLQNEYVPREHNIELTPENKEFIEKNCEMLGTLEISRIIFDNTKLTNLHQETRIVAEFIKSLNRKTFDDPNDVPRSEYTPPRSTQQVIARINKYVENANLSEDTLTGKQRKDVRALIGFLYTYRFRYQINTYEDEKDRDLFESTFVRHTYDKHDLTEEEVDQYLSLAIQIVNTANIQVEIDVLKRSLREAAEEEDPKISMSIVEAINQARAGAQKAESTCQKLIEDLKGKRSTRLEKQLRENASILNLVQLWKEEVSRKRLIRLQQLRQEKLKEAVKEIMGMDELRARILGLSEEEIYNG